jgi:hypothetical protein
MTKAAWQRSHGRKLPGKEPLSCAIYRKRMANLCRTLEPPHNKHFQNALKIVVHRNWRTTNITEKIKKTPVGSQLLRPPPAPPLPPIREGGRCQREREESRERSDRGERLPRAEGSRLSEPATPPLGADHRSRHPLGPAAPPLGAGRATLGGRPRHPWLDPALAGSAAVPLQLGESADQVDLGEGWQEVVAAAARRSSSRAWGSRSTGRCPPAPGGTGGQLGPPSSDRRGDGEDKDRLLPLCRGAGGASTWCRQRSRCRPPMPARGPPPPSGGRGPPSPPPRGRGHMDLGGGGAGGWQR